MTEIDDDYAFGARLREERKCLGWRRLGGRRSKD